MYGDEVAVEASMYHWARLKKKIDKNYFQNVVYDFEQLLSVWTTYLGEASSTLKNLFRVDPRQ